MRAALDAHAAFVDLSTTAAGGLLASTLGPEPVLVTGLLVAAMIAASLVTLRRSAGL
jgi:hypothetical protein